MTKRARLGDCDEMFRRFFDRWYDEDARKLKGFDATRPDVMEVPEYVGQTVAQVCPLTEAAACDVLAQVEAMYEAAEVDWPTYLPVRPPIDLGWVKSFDEYYNLARVEDLARRSVRPTSGTITWSPSASSERSSVRS